MGNSSVGDHLVFLFEADEERKANKGRFFPFFNAVFCWFVGDHLVFFVCGRGAKTSE